MNFLKKNKKVQTLEPYVVTHGEQISSTRIEMQEVTSLLLSDNSLNYKL
jgi:hypothetical protein